MIGMPEAEFEISIALVKQLIKTQNPSLSNLKITELGIGWDNHMFKLGDDMIIRLPRNKVSEKYLLNEVQYLPTLASKLPIDIPTPIFQGAPNETYPVHWSIIPYFEGLTVNRTKVDASEVFRLANFLKCLHATPNMEHIGSHNGRLLHIKAPDIAPRIERLKTKTSCMTSVLDSIYQAGLDSQQPEALKLVHGDIHPRNIIVVNQKFSAIIDWGDMTMGDPAVDLGSLWILFDDRQDVMQALEQYGASSAEITRSKAWAVVFGIIMLDSGLVDHPEHADIGKKILEKMHLMH